MVARFGTAGAVIPADSGSQSMVTSAKRALQCDPLNSYLHAITVPLTFSRVLTDMDHSFAWTTMSFSSDPVKAESQLCGHRLRA